ncbi:MAG TPA: hypothetical protein VFV99_28770 [Kofleriaceae bacterium]|nr:hypothetical protein [Kofleriaceae bacterium]
MSAEDGMRGDSTTILHYDGTQWTRMPVPVGLTVPTDGTLSDVLGRTSDDVFAVGGRLLLHYDGMHWSPMT